MAAPNEPEPPVGRQLPCYLIKKRATSGDLPQAPPDHHMHLPPRRGLGTSADMLELLTAAGIFLTAVAAVGSISSIVLGETVEASTAGIICLSWVIGATMQIAAGVIARIKLARAVERAKLALFVR